MKVIKSYDGSATLFNQEFGECYNSLKDGAYTEALHKHVLPPIYFGKLFEKPCLKILDICFGLGYNSFVSALIYKKMGYRGKIEIFSPEKDTDVFEKILSIQYPDEFTQLDIPKLVTQLLDGNSRVELLKDIGLEVFMGNALDYLEGFESQSIDIVYQDAFSPKVNTELWSLNYFLQLAKITHKNCIVTTYSLNQDIYLNARNSGFCVYRYNSKHTKKSTLFTKAKLLENDALEFYGDSTC